jgi:septal ring factor EnvC (AmiA/AmiB activator)
MSDDPTIDFPKAQDETLSGLVRRVETLEERVEQKLRQTTPLSSQLTELKEYVAACFREIIEWQTRMEERQTRTEERQDRMEQTQTRMEEGRMRLKRSFGRSGEPCDVSMLISQRPCEIRMSSTIE